MGSWGQGVGHKDGLLGVNEHVLGWWQEGKYNEALGTREWICAQLPLRVSFSLTVWIQQSYLRHQKKYDLNIRLFELLQAQFELNCAKSAEKAMKINI